MRNLIRLCKILLILIWPMEMMAQKENPAIFDSYFRKYIYDLSDKRMFYRSYYNSVFQDTADISITVYNKTTCLWIKAQPLDKLDLKGGLLVPEDNHSRFIDILEIAKSEYSKLCKWAKENKVEKFSKNLDISFDAGAFYFIGKRWQTETNLPMDIQFKVIKSEDSIRHLLIVRTNHLNLESKEYGNFDGYGLYFQSENEIQNFINLLDQKTIQKFIVDNKQNKVYRKEEFSNTKDSILAYRRNKHFESQKALIEKRPFFKHFSWGVLAGVNYKFITSSQLEKTELNSYSSKTDIPFGAFASYNFGQLFAQTELTLSFGNLPGVGTWYKTYNSYYSGRMRSSSEFLNNSIEFIKAFTYDYSILGGINILKPTKSTIGLGCLIGPDFRFLGDVTRINLLSINGGISRDSKMIAGIKTGLIANYKSLNLGLKYCYYPEGNKTYSYLGMSRSPMNSLTLTLGYTIFSGEKVMQRK